MLKGIEQSPFSFVERMHRELTARSRSIKMPRRDGRNRPGWYDRYMDGKTKKLTQRAKRKNCGTSAHGLHPKRRVDTYREPKDVKGYRGYRGSVPCKGGCGTARFAVPQEVRQVRGSETLMEPDRHAAKVDERLEELRRLRELDEAGEFAETDQKILWALQSVLAETEANGKRLDAIQATIKQGFDDMVRAIEELPSMQHQFDTQLPTHVDPDTLGMGSKR